MAVTIGKIGQNTNSRILELYGKSSDIKPIDFIDGVQVINGSVLIEIDTGDSYFYDEETHTWIAT